MGKLGNEEIRREEGIVPGPNKAILAGKNITSFTLAL